MKCILLKISNFMGIGEAALDLSDKGLVAIQGVNDQDSSANSNGAGKSSIADALFWCIYGETARDGLSSDAVVNRKAGKNTLVEAHWLDSDDKVYIIKRWRKHNIDGKKNGVSLDVADASGYVIGSLTKGKDTLTQVEIDRVIGCSREVFTAAVYAGQEKLPNLPAMTDSELKQLIEKASGVDVLVAAYKVAREKQKEVEMRHDKWRAEHVRMENEVTAAQERLTKLRTERESYEEKRRDKIKVLSDTFNDHIRIAKTRQTERDKIDPVRIQSEIDKLDAKINAVADEQLEEEALLDDLRDAQNRSTTLEAHFNRAKKDVNNQKKKLDDINSLVGKPCTDCGKLYKEGDIADVKKIADDKLRTLASVARELRDDLATQQKVHDERQANVAEHRAARTDIKSVIEERKRYAEYLANRLRAIDALEAEKKAATRVKEQIDTLKKENNPFVDLVENADWELDKSATAFRGSEELGVELEKLIMIHKDVVKVYGPAGVRAHVLDTVTPFLNDRTSEYLGVMSDGNIHAIWSTLSLNAKRELVEKFAITVEKTNDSDSFAGLSGGEKRKVRLACALALQDLVASRANKAIELMVYDEVDDALDEAGLERLMTIFQQKGRERGSVLIISHNSLSDWINQIVTVSRNDGVSTVDGGICSVV